MSRCYDKNDLYLQVIRVRNYLEITESDYPLDTVEICKCLDIADLSYIPFNTVSLKAMAVMSNEKDQIFLRDGQARSEHNFFCGHEMIHLFWHRDDSTTVFNCYDKVTPHQNTFLEW